MHLKDFALITGKSHFYDPRQPLKQQSPHRKSPKLSGNPCTNPVASTPFYFSYPNGLGFSDNDEIAFLIRGIALPLSLEI